MTYVVRREESIWFVDVIQIVYNCNLRFLLLASVKVCSPCCPHNFPLPFLKRLFLFASKLVPLPCLLFFSHSFVSFFLLELRLFLHSIISRLLYIFALIKYCIPYSPSIFILSIIQLILVLHTILHHSPPRIRNVMITTNNGIWIKDGNCKVFRNFERISTRDETQTHIRHRSRKLEDKNKTSEQFLS
jgi:hypothetical protein